MIRIITLLTLGRKVWSIFIKGAAKMSIMTYVERPGRTGNHIW